MTTPDWGQAGGYLPVSPLLPSDPPKVGDFWLDARLHATPAGVAFTAHRDLTSENPDQNAGGLPGQGQPAMVILLSEGAAADAAARDRLAGLVNAMHIDAVLARGGHGQDFGRLGRKYRSEDDDPQPPDDRIVAPWVALAYDGSPAAAAEAATILDEIELATLPPQGTPSGPDYQHYWIEKVRPGLARLWPLPWPGRFDRAGWRTILVSWLLMLLLAALAVLIAILIFRHQPPQTPPPPSGSSGSPPPQSSSPQSGSPSGSPQSGSPSPGSASPKSGSPSPGSGSPSASGSGSPSPSGTQSGGGQPTSTGTAGATNTPGSKL
jgi:hypothetical protein